jgi:hypothetical protein
VYYGLSAAAGITGLPLWTLDVVAVIILNNMSAKLGMTQSQIVNDPRTRKILNKGIMRASQKAAANAPQRVQNQIANTNAKLNSQINEKNS